MTIHSINFNPGRTAWLTLTTILATAAPKSARRRTPTRGDNAISGSNTPSLLEQIAQGDRDAVGRCIDQYGGLVWTLARRFCANAADAEDAVQEIFTDLWSSAGRFDPKVASETTFVAMIARRRLIDQQRKRGRAPRVDTIDSAPEPPAACDPTENIAINEEADRAKQALATLNPQQQAAIKLSVYDGHSHREIADELELPVGTVKTHIRRGLMRIRESLGEQAEEVAS